MADKAILEGWLYVPLAAIADVGALKEQLTFLSRKAAPDDPPILLYTEERPGYLGVPREYGLHRFPALEVEDRTVDGVAIAVPRLPDPNHPRVRDPVAQAKFMADLRTCFDQHDSYVAMAPTGSGKTVASLHTAAMLGRRTLILVHLERLMHQWVKEIHEKLGVPLDRIGIVQQDRCEWQDKDFVVGLLHSVCRRDYGQDFYRAFGLVIYDEVHKIGSQFFAPAVHKFSARRRLGLSATPTRRDGGDRVFFWHLGPIRVTSTAEALPLKVMVVDYTTRMPKLWGKMHGSRMKCLTLDADRNLVLAQVIRRFYRTGRQALVVSESVMHLQRLMSLAERLGVPRSAMGQYTAETHEYMDDPDKPGKKKLVKTKQTKQTLDDVQRDAQIIFATYGMITEGIDIPRLDAGVDATPRWEATQLIGRVRRPMPGKKRPVWVTIRDVRCSMSQGYFHLRCKDYDATRAEVVHYGKETKDAHTSRGSSAESAVLGGGAKRAAPGTLPVGPEGSAGGNRTGEGNLSPQTGRGRLGSTRRGLPGKLIQARVVRGRA